MSVVEGKQMPEPQKSECHDPSKRKYNANIQIEGQVPQALVDNVAEP